MDAEKKKEITGHPVFQVIGYLDQHSPFPIGSLLLGFLGGAYLLNPTFGLLELIPDTTPLIGNLDEATAAFLLFWSVGNMVRWWRVRQAQQRAQKEAEKEEA